MFGEGIGVNGKFLPGPCPRPMLLIGPVLQ